MRFVFDLERCPHSLSEGTSRWSEERFGAAPRAKLGLRRFSNATRSKAPEPFEYHDEFCEPEIRERNPPLGSVMSGFKRDKFPPSYPTPRNNGSPSVSIRQGGFIESRGFIADRA